MPGQGAVRRHVTESCWFSFYDGKLWNFKKVKVFLKTFNFHMRERIRLCFKRDTHVSKTQ